MDAGETSTGNSGSSRNPRKPDHRNAKNMQLPTMSCVICAEENVRYAAVGSCDHPICSFCSLRIRVKSSDSGCPLCKQEMSIVVVYPTKPKGEQPYASFGILDLDSIAPGLDIDHRAGMFYADCKDHFREMDKIRSIVCPLKKCNLRFPSNEALLKHLSTSHQGNHLCRLCLDNRPLFISEHRLMTTGELKKHMTAPPGALTGAGGDKTAGHPLCLFCNENFFDSHALYLHMKQEHQSCHLCPTNYQFRFYPTVDELRDHLHSEHFVCHICEKASNNGDGGPGVFGSSFRNHSDYSAHLRSYHNVRNTAMTLGFRAGYEPQGDDDNGGGVGGRGKRRARQNKRTGQNQLAFLDLDMAAADPNRNNSSQQQNRNTGNQGNSRGTAAAGQVSAGVNNSQGLNSDGHRVESDDANEARRRQLFHLQTSAAIASTPLVPAHMRVAGRVVAGAFRRDAEDDALQAEADEQVLVAAAVSNSLAPPGRVGWAGRSGNYNSLNTAFPALSSTSSSSQGKKQSDDSQGQKGSAPAPHPMSLIGGIQREAAAKKALEDAENAKKAEALEKLTSRNMTLANALHIRAVGNSQTSTASALSALLDISEMMRPLYPATLVTWARNNKVTVQKLEKQIHNFMDDHKLHSTQLKPMTGSQRNMVHGVARYYLLNSHEYDQEPHRYISLVKTADSKAPTVRLSSACSTPTLNPTNVLMTLGTPTLFLTLANPSSGYVATDIEGRGKRKSVEEKFDACLGGNALVSDAVNRIKSVIKAQLAEHFPYSIVSDHRIVSIKAAGPSAVSQRYSISCNRHFSSSISWTFTDKIFTLNSYFLIQVALNFESMTAVLRVYDMIAIYKKSGVSSKNDITPGLLDPFYIDPAFNPDELRESSAPSNPTDDTDRASVIDSADFFGDLESSTPKYSMRMPVSVSSMKSAARSSVAPAVISAPYYAALDDEWASSPVNSREDKKDSTVNTYIDNDDDWEDESSWTQMKRGGPKSPTSLHRTLPPSISSTTSFMNNSKFNGAIGPPPGFEFEKFEGYYDTDQTEKAIEESKKYDLHQVERDTVQERNCDTVGDVLVGEQNGLRAGENVESVGEHDGNNDSDWAIVDAEKGEA